MYVFDCALMKYPNTGLFAFSDNLARCLAAYAVEQNEQMGFYVPEKYIGRWGDKVSYMKLRTLHKLYLPANGVDVWHAAYQRSRYLPPKGTRMVLTVHDLNFLYDKPAYKHRKHLKWVQDRVDRADRIVAISEYARKDVEEHVDLKGKKVDVIYNGLNFFDGDITAPERIPRRPFLFSVGTVLPKKNFHVLPVLLQDNDYELIIAGNRSSYEVQIMDEAKKYGVEDRVFITGPVSEPVKYWYIKNCMAFLFPSLAEGFGLPVIEAMYYQKPVFLSDHTSLPEIGSRFAFYFDHDFDRILMKRKFQEVMSVFDKGGSAIDRLKEEMKQHAESFSWERTARKYFDIYRDLASR